MIATETRGDGPPLVLVHGLATSRLIWRRVVPALAGGGRRVVTLDVPGFGASPPAGAGFDLDAVADAIAGALDEAGPIVLVGHSMGGAVAITLAERHPGLVGRLVLVAPAGLRAMPRSPARAAGEIAARAIAVRRVAAPLADLRWGRRLLMAPGTVDPASLPPAEVRAMLGASRGSTRTAAALATVATADLRPALRALPQPLGLIWGDGDRVIPPGGVETVRACRPDAAVEVIPRTGHIPMMERPEAFAHALEHVLSPDGHTAAPSRT